MDYQVASRPAGRRQAHYVRQVGQVGQVGLAFVLACSSAFAQQSPDFDLPLKCSADQPCFLQNLMDMDSGPAHRDPFCNAATYNGHKGTDIRLRNFNEVRSLGHVYAMADGMVTGTRSKMADRLMVTEQDRLNVRGRECGNGMVIDFGTINGASYTSQLCHLAQDSITVRTGDKVKRGQYLGRIGLSGATEFPHLHFSMRQNGKLIDPITGRFADQPCSTDGFNNSLFSPAALRVLQETGFQLFLEDGFADGPVDRLQVVKSQVRLPRQNSAFVYFAKFINLKKGDYLQLSIAGPNGIIASSQTKPMDRNKATFTAYVGKRRPPKSGVYVGKAELVRNGKTISARTSDPFSF